MAGKVGRHCIECALLGVSPKHDDVGIQIQLVFFALGGTVAECWS